MKAAKWEPRVGDVVTYRNRYRGIGRNGGMHVLQAYGRIVEINLGKYAELADPKTGKPTFTGVRLSKCRFHSRNTEAAGA